MERVNSKGSFLTHPTNDARWLERRRPENVFDDNSDFDNRCQFISITSNGIYIMVKCMFVCMYVMFLLILPSPFFDIFHFFLGFFQKNKEKPTVQSSTIIGCFSSSSDPSEERTKVEPLASFQNTTRLDLILKRRVMTTTTTLYRGHRHKSSRPGSWVYLASQFQQKIKWT